MPPKRRRRFQGLYYHSSPPKVLPMNGQLPNDGGRRRRDTDDFSVKLSTIRIWMHEKDIGKLTRILWAGQGNRLRQQASTNSKVKRFLTAVPYVMNSIRDVHQAVIDNSLETLQANLEPPVPPALVTCRDANGLNLIHKAAGLGHATILEYLITTWPDGVHECDITGKTPLHWAASAKNNMRCYTLLTQAGCDEEAVDYKMKTPSFYRHKPHEIERAFLTYVPEAPRVSPDVATDWEALSEESGDGKKLDIRIPEMNGFGRHSNAESNENTSEAEMTEGASAADDDEAIGGGGETEAEPEPEPETETEPDHAHDEPEDTPVPEDEPNKEDETAKEEETKDDAKDQEEEEESTPDDEDDKNEEDEDEPQDEKQAQSVSESDTKAPKDEQEDTKDESKSEESPENTANEALTNEESNDKTADKTEESKTENLDESNENKEEKEQEDGSETVNKEEEIIKETEAENKQDEIVKDEIKNEDKDDNEDKEKEKGEGHLEIENSESNKDNQESEAADTVEKDNDEKEENEKETPEKLIEENKDNSEEKGNEEDETNDNKDDHTEKAPQDDNVEINGKLQVDDQNENDTENEHAMNSIEKEEDEKLLEEDKHTEKGKQEDQKEEKENSKTETNDAQETKNNTTEQRDETKEIEKVQDTANETTDVKEEVVTAPTGKETDNDQEINNEIIDQAVESGEQNEKANENVPDTKDDSNDEKDIMKQNDKQNDHKHDKENDENVKDTENEANDNKNETNDHNGKEKDKDEETKDDHANGHDESPVEAEEPQITKEKETLNGSAQLTPADDDDDSTNPDPKPSGSTPSVKDESTAKSPPNGKDDSKTDEDENNNSTKSPETKAADDNVVEVSNTKPTLSDISEETAENGESFLKEAQQGISDKFEEISENLKDNVKILSDKIKNVFSSSDDKGDAEANNETENESQDVVVHSSSANTSAKGPKQNGVKHAAHGNGESSDDTNEDEDEESEAEAADDKNDDEEQKDVEEKDNEADEAAENAEEQEADNQPPLDESDNEAETGNDADKSAGGGAGDSHTSSLAIEGFVQGEAEDNTVQSQTAAYVDEDDEESRISRIIKTGDMEQLAQIVLNGDGQKLLDVEATEPEIQAFLRNVPNYMEKIRRVHEAARGGSLLNLQQALDRRKFAVAKDEISPDGATPLHVAVLFGHSDIVRYLAARFPETTTITDNDDRTALHYAAVVNDNGHFYNVLLQLGANPKALDKMGIAPEQYLGNDDLRKDFNYSQLLKKFGAEELEAELLSDQGQIENPSFQANPIFKTEQGKYLADNLADPLIKALTQVAHKRPQDPLQYLTNYLQNFVSTRNTNGKTLVQAAVHSGSSHTNSTALVNSNPSPTRQFQNSQMNGHVTYDNSDDIEDDTLNDDDGNDSDAALSKKLEERDEHGQSMLHFASARSHRRGGLLHLIEESKADITYRDELYRTARDVALQANQVGNAKEIDRYLISLAIVGDVKPFEHFALSGYDHIIDVMDDNEVPIVDVVEAKGHTELATYLKGVRPMEEQREELHQMIRDNRVERVKEIVDTEDGKMLIMAKNYYGRTALHIAILKELEDIVEHFVNICPEALKIGDNLERTPLHYAMGTNLVEGVSRVLIQNGAKRTNKDLKGRQPSYYFMNKADILRLQEEEDENR